MERIERIEEALLATANGLASTQVVLKNLAESQKRTQDTVAEVVQLFPNYVDASDARMKRIEENLERIEENLDGFIEGSDTRMKRIEENLDGLIRAITAEHSNGKG